MDHVAIIILHYKHFADTVACLESLHATEQWYPIIVVANQTQPEELAAWKEQFPSVHWIAQEQNSGFAAGNNVGIGYAQRLGCEAVILLNNDTVVAGDFVPTFVSSVMADPLVGLASPKIYFAPGQEYHADRYQAHDRGKVFWYAGGLIDWANVYASHRGVDEVDHGQYNEHIETAFATGCCLYIRMDVVRKIGGFDERYFLYYEDVDYSIRAKKAGFRVAYLPQASLWHKNAASSDAPGSALHAYYQTRNRLYFGYRYASLRTKKSLVLESLRMMRMGGVQQEAVWDYYVGRMGKRHE